jgi:O-antigen/teichoic acid export membrane protein
MLNVFSRLRARLGDFWWYSLLVFVSARLGDVINAFVGLWLVPKYVPQEELGAVLPLTQVAGVFGLPLGILVYTYMKFLNTYNTDGELGKVKALIRTFIVLFIAAALLGTVVSIMLMPHFFERIRIVSGSLGVIILASAVLGAISPVFITPLQALKRFNAYTLINFLTAPLRLVVMLVAMPFRALSGYMLGQASVPAFQILASIFVLRRDIHPSIKAVPFWREDGGKMVRYSLGVTGWIGVATLIAAVQSMIIRQRLPEVESAAYYMISRFAELGTYLGLSISALLFPFAAEAHAKGQDASRLFIRTSLVALGFGLLVAVGLAVLGKPIFELMPPWQPYVPYVTDMVLLSVALTLYLICGNFCAYEVANNRFSFLCFTIPQAFLTVGFQACFTGYSFFDGILPAGFVAWMKSLEIGTLRNFIISMLVPSLVGILYVILVFRSRLIENQKQQS